MALSFGVTSTGGYGVLDSVSINETAEVAEARDENGAVTDQKAYSKTVEATLEGYFDGDSLAGAGTLMTAAGITNGVVTAESVTRATPLISGSASPSSKKTAPHAWPLADGWIHTATNRPLKPR